MPEVVWCGQLLELPDAEPQLGRERQPSDSGRSQTDQQGVDTERKVGRISRLNIDQSQDNFSVFVFVDVSFDQAHDLPDK